jgi:hypothetical protein
MARSEEKGRKSLSVAQRNGVWHAGERRCGSYQEALKLALRAAQIKPPRTLRPSLESRDWWPAFIEWRTAREAARAAEGRL